MAEEVPDLSLKTIFELYSKLGDSKSDGNAISLLQSDKWLKQAGIIDGKRITTIDTGTCFNKFRLQKIVFEDFVKFVEDLAVSKRLDPEAMKQKLTECGLPMAAFNLPLTKGVPTTDAHLKEHHRKESKNEK